MTAVDHSAQRGHGVAAVDLLGVMACGELLAFERLAHDAALAPTMADKAELARMAVAEFNHFTVLRTKLAELGVDPNEAMAPFVEPLTEFHRRTASTTWLEGLVKAYVGDGLAADFYREIAAHLDPATAALILEVLADTGHSGFVVARVREAIAEDPRVAGRLALWGRRLVGEAMTQAQRVAGEREALAALIVGGDGREGTASDSSERGTSERDKRAEGLGLAEIGHMLERLTDAHSARMAALGLDA